MKINPSGIPNYITGKQRIGNTGGIYENNIAQPGDEIALSNEALSFSKVFAAAKESYFTSVSSPATRISSLAEQVGNGSYYIDSETIAASLLGDL